MYDGLARKAIVTPPVPYESRLDVGGLLRSVTKSHSYPTTCYSVGLGKKFQDFMSETWYVGDRSTPSPAYWGLAEDDFGADALEAVALGAGAAGPASLITLSISW
jgi:hypothetical protein